MPVVRFVDLFAGIGGLRLGLEEAARRKGLATVCVFTSEIKWAAREILQQNHPQEVVHGDIREVDASTIPDFDFLLVSRVKLSQRRVNERVFSLRAGRSSSRSNVFWKPNVRRLYC